MEQIPHPTDVGLLIFQKTTRGYKEKKRPGLSLNKHKFEYL